MHLAVALHPVDWALVGLYVVFALAVGIRYARRAGQDVDEFFLSGRSLPWWIAGTSMVATTFAADTPLVVTGWVRDHGIWKNWLWWCYAAGGMMTVFMFARYWRRGRVMTTAELSELRYQGADASALRATLGGFHALIYNTIVLCWVILAAAKICEVVFEIDKVTAVTLAGVAALSYSLLSGFWGVVITDLVQFVMAMTGAVALAILAWNGVGGLAQVESVLPPGSTVLDFFPQPGEGTPLDASFWSVAFTAVVIYLGVAWWATHGVDGGGVVVQRIAATKDERAGVLAALWYSVANYALRPWPWFLVALASLVVLPNIEVKSPFDGEVVAIVQDVEGETGTQVVSVVNAEGEREDLALGGTEEWRPKLHVDIGDELEEGDTIAKTDSESAYPVMMTKYLPIGLLGLMVASLFAAFMSTIDTHVNLAASYFVNDLWRRFFVRDAAASHYVLVARLASVLVLILGSALAVASSSIGDLFTFFIALLGGVGPIYVMRWLWWRVRAATELVAMIASCGTTVALTFLDIDWQLGPLSTDGALSDGGRLMMVVGVSLSAAMISLVFTPKPDPAGLVDFYRKVRPMGAWRPVRSLCRDVAPRREGVPVMAGVLGGLLGVYGLMFGIGHAIFGRFGPTLMCAAAITVGAGLVWWSLHEIELEREGSEPA